MAGRQECQICNSTYGVFRFWGESQFGDASQLGSIGRRGHGYASWVLLGLPFNFHPLLLLSHFRLSLARLGVLHRDVDGPFDRLSIWSDLGWLGLSSILKFIRALVGSSRQMPLRSRLLKQGALILFLALH